MTAITRRFDKVIATLVARRHRLIGLSLMRIIIGAAAVMFYVSDYGNRNMLWGPDSYNSPADARISLPHGLFSLYLFNDSAVWFEILFNLGIVVAVLFTIFGGRALTIAHAVFMWSIYNRNQDLLEGGDNLARIMLIFMVFTTTNAYFAPHAAQRRAALSAADAAGAGAGDGVVGATRAAGRHRVGNFLHNAASIMIVFQIAVVYFTSGYLKASASIWTSGVAMYYVSRINQFDMFGLYGNLMSSPYLGTIVCYMTIITEIALPFTLLATRRWIRELNVFLLEGMHFGIIVCMGLVCFGMIMIGADCMALRDSDYQALNLRFMRLRAMWRIRRRGALAGRRAPVPARTRRPVAGGSLARSARASSAAQAR